MIHELVEPAPFAPFTAPAPDERIARVAAALERHNIEAIVVNSGAEARARVLAMIPDGTEVHWGKSRTLDEIGLTPELLTSGRYDPLRPRYVAMDRATQGREIRKLVAAPDVMLGSVQAITDDGALVAVSYAGSQIGPYASGAGRVILSSAARRSWPISTRGCAGCASTCNPTRTPTSAHQLGVPTRLAKLLVVFEEPRSGRTTVVLVREPVGV